MKSNVRQAHEVTLWIFGGLVTPTSGAVYSTAFSNSCVYFVVMGLVVYMQIAK